MAAEKERQIQISENKSNDPDLKEEDRNREEEGEEQVIATDRGKDQGRKRQIHVKKESQLVKPLSLDSINHKNPCS